MSLKPGDAADIRYEDRDGYLYAFVSGKVDNLAVSLDFWERVANTCHARGYKKVLVEERFDNQVEAFEMYELIAEARKWPNLPAKIAFVDQVAEENDLNQFGENVAVNRGLTPRLKPRNTPVFMRVEAWLRRI